MQIKEILELTMTKNIASIAKEHLTIGEKRVRAILKDIGATNQAGKKGWYYEGDDPNILEKSIYDFVQPKAVNKVTNERKNERRLEQNNQPTKEQTKESTNVVRKRASFDIDTNLLKELKIFAIKTDKNVYEVVEQAIKEHIRGK